MTKIFYKKDSEKNRRFLRKNMTEEEVILWTQLKNSNLNNKFRRQVSIGKYIADFYCVKRKLVIEIDGSQHIDNKEYDKERESYMKSLGIKTIRFWNGDIRKNLNGVLLKIREGLKTPLSDKSSTSPKLGEEK